MRWLAKPRSSQGGYTVVETMIVFGVSAMMVLSVIALVSGKQGRETFVQAVRNTDGVLQDVLNDLSTGYYSRNSGMTCTANLGEAPELSAVENELGSNNGCVFAGRIFYAPFGSNDYTIHTMVGRQNKSADFDDPVENLAEAKPVIIAQGTRTANPKTGGFPNLGEQKQYPGGMKLAWAEYVDPGGSPIRTTVFGVVTDFGYQAGVNAVRQSPQVFVLKDTAVATINSNASLSDQITAAVASDKYLVNVPLKLCFNSDSSNQHGTITLGSDKVSSTTTTTTIEDGLCP